jgi:hypothetical protein
MPIGNLQNQYHYDSDSDGKPAATTTPTMLETLQMTQENTFHSNNDY